MTCVGRWLVADTLAAFGEVCPGSEKAGQDAETARACPARVPSSGGFGFSVPSLLRSSKSFRALPHMLASHSCERRVTQGQAAPEQAHGGQRTKNWIF